MRAPFFDRTPIYRHQMSLYGATLNLKCILTSLKALKDNIGREISDIDLAMDKRVMEN